MSIPALANYLLREKPVEITPDGRGVRFDIYAEDDAETVYDVEMQNANVDFLPKRARYAQAMLDLNLMERSMEYRKLRRSFVIYICRFNLFPKIGRRKYSFAKLCREDPSIELGDEAEIIFLCAKGTDNTISERLQAFLDYVSDGTATNQFTNALETAVLDAKIHEQWRVEYMTLLDHYERERSEGIEIGRAQGIEIGRSEGIEIGRVKGRDEGIEIGRAEEQKNTERERRHAEAAEKRIAELERQIAQLTAES